MLEQTLTDNDAQIRADDFDSSWKEAVEHYFPELMAFYFPKAYDQTDWTLEPVFLDQELRAVVQDAEPGKRFVDKRINNGPLICFS